MNKLKLFTTASVFVLTGGISVTAQAGPLLAEGGTLGTYTLEDNITLTGEVSDLANFVQTATVILGTAAAGKTLRTSNFTITTHDNDATINTTGSPAGANIIVNAGGLITRKRDGGTVVNINKSIGTITLDAAFGGHEAGKIIATGGGTAISFTASGMTTNIDNSGIISSGVGAAIKTIAKLTGSIENKETGIITSGAVSTGVINLSSTVSGGIINAGQIRTTANTGVAINISGSTDVTNSETGGICAASDCTITGTAVNGVAIKTTTVSTAEADLVNKGSIYAGALEIDGRAAILITNIYGKISNEGLIHNKAAGSAIKITGTGSITALTNSSTGKIISAAAGDNATLSVGSASTTDIINEGTIETTAIGTAVKIAADLTGNITNSGIIKTVDNEAANAILLTATGSLTSITNTGTIDAGVAGDAIDLNLSDVANTINSSGIIKGHIKLGNTASQIVNLTGGNVTGNILGNATAIDDTINIIGDVTVTGDINLNADSNDVINIGSNTTKAMDNLAITGSITGVEDINVKFGKATFTSDSISLSGIGADDDFTIDEGAQAIFAANDTVLKADNIIVNGTLEVNSGKIVTFDADTNVNASFGAASTLKFNITDEDTYAKIILTDADDTITFTDNATIQINTTNAEMDSAILENIITKGNGTITADLTKINLVKNFVLDVKLTKDADGNIDAEIIGNTLESKATSAIDKAFTKAIEFNTGKEFAKVIDTNTSVTGGPRAVIKAALIAETTETGFKEVLSIATADASGVGHQVTQSVSNIATDNITGRIAVAMLRGVESGIAAGNNYNDSSAWGEIFTKNAEQDIKDGVQGYDADTNGFSLGFDRQIADNLLAGVAVTYADTQANTAANGSTEIETIQLSLYSSYSQDNWYVNGLVGMGFNDINIIKRSSNVILGLASSTADAEGRTFAAAAEFGMAPDQKYTRGLNVTPNILLQYVNSEVGAHSLSGNINTAQEVGASKKSSLETGLGVDVNHTFKSDNLAITPEFRAKWLYDFIADPIEVTSTLAGTTGTAISYSAEGAGVDKHRFVVGVGMEVMTQDNLTVSLDYDLEYRDTYEAHTGALNVRAEF